MFLSVFEMFKIGIGPSSSHTVGPMVAAARFLDQLRQSGVQDVVRISVSLHGSLAFTGKGHGSDRAVVLGLLDERPDAINPDSIEQLLEEAAAAKTLNPTSLPAIAFDPARDIVFDYGPPLPGHANGMIFRALSDDNEVLLETTFYSVGGGFVMSAAELDALGDDESPVTRAIDAPYPFGSAREMLEMGIENRLTIAEMKRANELVLTDPEALDAQLDRIWSAMNVSTWSAVGGSPSRSK